MAPSDWTLWVALAGLVTSLATAVISGLVTLLLAIIGWVFISTQVRFQRSLDAAWKEIRDVKERNAQFSHLTAANIAIKGDIEAAMDRMTDEFSRLEGAFIQGLAKVTAELKDVVGQMMPRSEAQLREVALEARLRAAP